MTDSEINRTIAESLEPYGGLVAYRPRPMMGSISKSKAWEADANHEWYARDFMGDPAMRDLLQSKLLEEGWLIMMAFSQTDVVVIQCLFPQRGLNFSLTDTRERIWPLAYLKAKGVK